MTLMQRWRYLNLTRELLHLISCESYLDLYANHF